MSLPCLEALLQTGLPVTVCGRPWARALLSAYPLHAFVSMQSSWWKNAQAIRQQRRVGVRSLGLLLPDSLSSALTFCLAGVASAGYRDDGRSLLLRWPVRKPAQPLHAVESWYFLTYQALSAWQQAPGAVVPPAQLGLRLSEPHHAQAQALLAESGLHTRPFVLIAPTATGLHRGQRKVWPAFDALTRRLQAHGVSVAMCPPPAEVQAARINAPTALCLPSLGLGAFAALAQRAALVVCNDSGVSHLAAAVQARQLTLFGVTDAARTGPWSAQAVCLGKAGHWPALETVFDTVLALL